MNNNSDWEELYRNFQKDQRRWGVVAKVPGKKGATIKVCTMMYKAVLQVVLMYVKKSGALPAYLYQK